MYYNFNYIILSFSVLIIVSLISAYFYKSKISTELLEKYNDKELKKSKVKYIYKGYNNLLKDYNTVKYTSGGIPKIIFKTSWQKREEFNGELITVLNDTIIINPDYNLYYFDNDEVDTFMKSYSKRAYDAYNKIVPGAFKADLFRYCILEKYGGCYSDIGHITYVPFDSICENNKLILVKDLFDNGIHNALMCATPHNEYIIKLVEECIINIENNYYGYSSLSITGPVLAGTVYYKHLLDLKYKNEILSFNKVMFNNYIKTGSANNIKILELKQFGKIETTNNDNNYIVDIHDKKLIRTKFRNYYKLMYTNSPYYNYYWLNKTVYKS